MAKQLKLLPSSVVPLEAKHIKEMGYIPEQIQESGVGEFCHILGGFFGGSFRRFWVGFFYRIPHDGSMGYGIFTCMNG